MKKNANFEDILSRDPFFNTKMQSSPKVLNKCINTSTGPEFVQGSSVAKKCPGTKIIS